MQGLLKWNLSGSSFLVPALAIGNPNSVQIPNCEFVTFSRNLSYQRYKGDIRRPLWSLVAVAPLLVLSLHLQVPFTPRQRSP